ncbi:RNA-directed DNA polymerase, eukaryota, reverse transcriptase zinc-binding domain protein, partial [Tanacetum coccineum]
MGYVNSITRGGGLNIGSLRAKNLALLGKWWWRFRREGESLWVRVIKSIHGVSGGFDDNRVLGGGRGGTDRGVWRDILRIGEEIDRLGLEFTSTCRDRSKEDSVRDKGSWVNGLWCWEWEWDWGRNIRGKACNDLEVLVSALQNVTVSNNYGHMEWSSRNALEQPKKVNIFVWRALKGRRPVREELDKRRIDLDSVLCLSCTNAIESCAHCLVTCDLAMRVWDK